jgi:predicted metal-binding membrane protein
MTARADQTGERWLIAILFGLAGVAWFVTRQLATPDMEVGPLTQRHDVAMSSMHDGASMQAGLFLVTWVVMMAAMMLPAIWPVLLIVRRWARRRGTWLPVASFVTGYLVVWTAAGAGAFGLLLVFESTHLVNSSSAVRLGGALVLGVGLYQLSPLKAVCLRHCRSPRAFLAKHTDRLTRSALGIVRTGATHGLYCLGCCWALMVLLLMVGMMSLAWMAGIAGLIFAEKVLPRGPLIGRVVAVLLVAAGIIVGATGVGFVAPA